MELSKRARLGVVLLSALFFLLALWYAASALVPFEPYRVYGQAAIPPRACSTGVVAIQIDYEVENLGPWGRVSGYDVTAHWQNVETGEETPEQKFPYLPINSAQGYGRHDVRSPLLRETPDTEGQWRMISDVRVDGRVLLWHRHQDYQYRSKPILVVDDAVCDDNGTKEGK